MQDEADGEAGPARGKRVEAGRGARENRTGREATACASAQGKGFSGGRRIKGEHTNLLCRGIIPVEESGSPVKGV